MADIYLDKETKETMRGCTLRPKRNGIDADPDGLRYVGIRKAIELFPDVPEIVIDRLDADAE